MVYAVVETGGKQYKVSQGDMIWVEKLEAEKGSSLSLEKVLLVNDDGKVQIGTPYLSGSRVVCEVLGDEKGEKIFNFKYRRRKGYRRKVGHRHPFTRLKVKEFVKNSK